MPSMSNSPSLSFWITPLFPLTLYRSAHFPIRERRHSPGELCETYSAACLKAEIKKNLSLMTQSGGKCWREEDPWDRQLWDLASPLAYPIPTPLLRYRSAYSSGPVPSPWPKQEMSRVCSGVSDWTMGFSTFNTSHNWEFPLHIQLWWHLNGVIINRTVCKGGWDTFNGLRRGTFKPDSLHCTDNGYRWWHLHIFACVKVLAHLHCMKEVLFFFFYPN